MSKSYIFWDNCTICTLGSVTLLTASESEWNGHNKMGATDYKNFYMLVWYDGNPNG